ncbi:dsRBD fold-containing protein [Streptomyces gamaensis]|uniref:DsRBD fold-containing protein n=1 Tax=Streptomyces gamaensis TaxID=1763542 RepID=A0ABW0YYM5_9ACTN
MPHTVEWKIRLKLVEGEGAGDGTTRAQAVLDTGTASFTGHGSARRAPGDREITAIGDEFAAGRALRDLGDQLLHTAEKDVEAAGAAPEPRTSAKHAWPL